MSILNLEQKLVFKYFSEISQIPRPSGHEEKISAYLENFGKERNFETYVDQTKNVLIRKPASKGYENSPGIIIQGHMDMVPEKSDDSNHDFLKDPISLIVEDDKIYANNTTLGADDGIGLAFALAILDDEEAQHGPLECLFTISEETTMEGAMNLSSNLLRGNLLLNIDSEEEGIMTVGSAGGENYLAKFNFSEVEIPKDYKVYELTFQGLLGGHSGMEISKNHGNIIKIMADLIDGLDDSMIANFNSGTKQNAIPRSGSLTLATKSNINSRVEKILEKFENLDGNLEILVKDSKAKSAMGTIDSNIFARYLLDLHNGVYSYTDSSQKDVESSANLAIVKKDGFSYDILVSIRSASEEKLRQLEEKYKLTSQAYKVSYEFSEGYPTWEYKKDSLLRDRAMTVYKKMFGHEMVTEITHGGLECGVFSEKYPNMDMISIGPDIRGAHTPKESLSISSTKRMYEYVKELLKELK